MYESIEGSGREATRARLLRAAYEVFAEVGLDKATVETICARARFSRGAFYSNFRTKDELFLELIDHVSGAQIHKAEDLVRRWRAAASAPGLPETSAESLAGVIQRIAVDATQSRTGVILMAEVRIRAMRDPETAEAYRVLRERTLAQVAEIITVAADIPAETARVAIPELARMAMEAWEAAATEAVIAGLDEAGIARAVSDRVETVARLTLEAWPSPPGRRHSSVAAPTSDAHGRSDP
ncbi:TetR/AcrR family transcriptional regulator [Microbacterium xanthum]|uniref:TetR/AcrR family transcriptional regulator n=1 Tax=Microbacterium xanthum TaxID=3079794 RepID=UPI002AD4B4E6|nr:helix-turn-helix domain-containing protein [Microbacterium sp. KSW-48]MDZ8170842.1 helix-turn-helix domain-containing protein [Microbacterium sp. KSW-48]